MAIVRLGAVVNSISGSVGATTFAHTKGGTVARALLRKPKQRNAAHLQQRGFYSLVRRGWRFLNPWERVAWNAAALTFPNTNRLGQTAPLSGFALYVKLNTDGLEFLAPGLDVPHFTTPPDLTVAAPMIASNFVMSLANGFTIDQVAPPGQPNTLHSLYGARTLRDTETTAPRSFRHILVGGFATPTITFTTAWDDIIGPPQLGEFCFLKARFAALNAVFSPPQIFSAFVTA